MAMFDKKKTDDASKVGTTTGGPARPEKPQENPAPAQDAQKSASPGGDKNLPATTRAGGVPDWLDEMSGEDAGRGVSTEASDNIVPMIVVLQKGSPQVNEQDPLYMPGAKAGVIWLRNSADEFVKPDEGFVFQPCHFDKVWPEWIPRDKGKGFVARHKNRAATRADVTKFGPAVELGEDVPDVEDATFVVDPKNKIKKWTRPNGNELKQTRNHAGFVVLGDGNILPYVIPLTGSGHTVSRNWMFAMMSKRRKDGSILPSWCVLYRLTARWRKNQAGDWWQFDVAEAGYIDLKADPNAYLRGKELADAFESGAKVAEADVAGATEEGSAGPQSSQGGGGNVNDDMPY